MDKATLRAARDTTAIRRHAARILRQISDHSDTFLTGAGIGAVVVASATGHLPPVWEGLVLLLALVGLITLTVAWSTWAAVRLDPDIRDGDLDVSAAAVALRGLTSDLRAGAAAGDVHEALNRHELLLATSETLDALSDALTVNGRISDAITAWEAARAIESADQSMVGGLEPTPEER